MTNSSVWSSDYFKFNHLSLLYVVQDWLRAENLLPHQTVEKLTKWTVYDDGGQARTIPAHNGRGPWESEDPTQDMLESRLVSTQVLVVIITKRHYYYYTADIAILEELHVQTKSKANFR